MDGSWKLITIIFFPSIWVCELFSTAAFDTYRWNITNVVRCAVWYHLHTLKNMNNTYVGVLLLVKFQAKASSFTKCKTHPLVFFSFFKLYKRTKLHNASHMVLRSNKQWKLHIFCIRNTVFADWTSEKGGHTDQLSYALEAPSKV